MTCGSFFCLLMHQVQTAKDLLMKSLKKTFNVMCVLWPFKGPFKFIDLQLSFFLPSYWVVFPNTVFFKTNHRPYDVFQKKFIFMCSFEQKKISTFEKKLHFGKHLILKKCSSLFFFDVVLNSSSSFFNFANVLYFIKFSISRTNLHWLKSYWFHTKLQSRAFMWWFVKA